jgi:hypothetical protein
VDAGCGDKESRLPLSHWQAGGETAPHVKSSGHAAPEEPWADVTDIHRMQSPGSIFGFAGRNVSVPAFPIKTVGVWGAALSLQMSGTSPYLQFGVTHAD